MTRLKFVITTYLFNSANEYNRTHNDGNNQGINTMSSSVSNLNLTPMKYDNGYKFAKEADGWIQMDVTATYISGSKYKLSTNWTWLVNPYYREIDVIGLGHDAGLTATNDPIYSYYQCDWKDSPLTGSGTWTWNNTPKSQLQDSGGAVVSYQLQNSYQYAAGRIIVTRTAYNHRGYLSYYANVNNTGLRYVSVYGKYAHQQTTYQISPQISWPLSPGFSVSSASSFDFMSPNPYCSIHVNY